MCPSAMKLNSNHYIKTLLLCSLFGVTINTALAIDKSDYAATYKVHYGQLPVGKVTRHFAMKNQNYNLTLTSEVLVPLYRYTLEQKSSGNWEQTTPTPGCFSEQMNEQLHSFCFTNKNLEKLYDKYKSKISNQTIIYDELSYQLAMQSDISAGKTKLSYWILRKQKLRNFQFQVLGQEVIDTPIGKMNTIKILRTHSNKPKTTTLWLSSKYNYLPIAAEQVRPNKSNVKVMLSELYWQGKPVTAQL